MASSVVTLSLPFHYLFYYLRVLKLALKETCWLIRTYIQSLMVPIKLNVYKLSARMQWLGAQEWDSVLIYTDMQSLLYCCP